MKELVIISGKGGTGKTSIVAAFASLAVNKVLSDADVDAADLHLIMNPQATERHDFQAGHSADHQPRPMHRLRPVQRLVQVQRDQRGLHRDPHGL